MLYLPPKVFQTKFTCPHCGVIAMQRWKTSTPEFRNYGDRARDAIRISVCDHCNEYSLWHFQAMVYPDRGVAPPPNPDMPESVQKYYNEAAQIAGRSPRAAAGLLRLAVQVLCSELGESGRTINDCVGSLVKKGLPATVQQSLDIVRVTGNSAVHPGQIDTDDEEVVASLFSLLNLIIEYMVSLPNRVSSLYNALPAGSLEQINKRDNLGA
jgi:hypothetical protein